MDTESTLSTLGLWIWFWHHIPHHPCKAIRRWVVLEGIHHCYIAAWELLAVFNSHLQDFQFIIYIVFVVASCTISNLTVVSLCLLLLVPEVDLPEAILVVKQTVTAVQATWPSLRKSFLPAYESLHYYYTTTARHSDEPCVGQI